MSSAVTTLPPARPGRLKVYLDFARPFTLLPPALGVLSGAVTAWGAGHQKPAITWALLLPVLYGTLMAAVLIPSIPLALLYNAFLDRFIKGFTGGAFR